MATLQQRIEVRTQGKGPVEITAKVAAIARDLSSGTGLVHVFCCHTSCSLVLMENADPSAWRDLQRWLERLVPEADRDFVHTLEGPDDMPSHIKMALTRSSETIPLCNGELLLGTWQGLFLWEHRSRPHTRTLVVSAIVG